jgi:hypothetical protein
VDTYVSEEHTVSIFRATNNNKSNDINRMGQSTSCKDDGSGDQEIPHLDLWNPKVHILLLQIYSIQFSSVQFITVLRVSKSRK